MSLVAFLECTVEEAKNLPPLNPSGSGVDSYVILWSSEKKKEEHKSKIHYKEVNPKYNETFGFVFDPKLIQSGRLSNEINFQFRNFKAIGTEKIGTPLVVPFSLEEEQENSNWYKIPGCNGEVKVTLMWRKMKQSEVPEIIKTHTGGSTKSYYNSITRTQLKKRIREGDRGGDSEVQYLTVKVLDSKDISGDIFFNAFLHSSQQITYKSPVKKNSTNPKWDEADFGFELVTVINNKVKDALRIELKNSKLFMENQALGHLFIPLDKLEPNSNKTQWYKLEGVTQGELKISLTRAPKKVKDLPIIATKGSARASKKLLYVLSVVRRRMADFGLKATVLVSMKLAVVATRIAVTIEPMSAEEIALIENEVVNAEKQVTEEEDDPSLAEENKSIFKIMLDNAVQSLFNNLKTSLKDMKSLGLTGSVGSSVFIGLEMYGIEFEIGVDVELA